MELIAQNLSDLLSSFRWADALDILIVAALIYYILLWLRGTRAEQLLRGIVLIIFIYAMGKLLNLYTINWLFEKFAAVIMILLIIVFQPELRRTLERFGRNRMLGILGFSPMPHGSWFVRQLIRAVENLAEGKIGAIVVIEKTSGLTEVVESGVRVDARLNAELILSIFSQKSPLHDGALIIQGDRIVAAGCLLPLSENNLLDRRLGTRHRAAVGLSEQSDAFIIVVSEKTGIISIAENGYLTRFLTREMLEEKIFSLYKFQPKKIELKPWKSWVKIEKK